MEPRDAAASTSKALEAALDAAQREREFLSQRLETVDRLIDDLSQTLSGSGDSQPSGRSATKRAGGRRAASKRTGRKRAAGTRKTTAKTSGKKATRKASTRKQAGGRARQRQAPGRTDRVIEIVNSADQPLSTGDVRAKLAETEPEVSSKLVSAALTYAARKGRIRKDNGRWAGAK
jgi:hypothetical protein